MKNDPEVPPMKRSTKNRFEAGEMALEAAGMAIKLVIRVPGQFKSIADQVIRSASSVPANLVEGNSRIGRDRVHYFRIAYGSAKEVDCHLRLLIAAGVFDSAVASEAIDLFDRVRGATWRLLHPKR